MLQHRAERRFWGNGLKKVTSREIPASRFSGEERRMCLLAGRGADCLCVMVEASAFNAQVIVWKNNVHYSMCSGQVICDRTPSKSSVRLVAQQGQEYYIVNIKTFLL